MFPFRIGSGHDTHRLELGRRLILAGVDIPTSDGRGLAGHSDADIVLHALTDAILGAAALGDIGELFPDTAAENKDRDSSDFVLEALKRLEQAGYRLGNIDITIFAQAPKLLPYRDKMRQSLADLCQLPLTQISLKAKTGERVGHIGRGEAMGCHVVVLIHQG